LAKTRHRRTPTDRLTDAEFTFNYAHPTLQVSSEATRMTDCDQNIQQKYYRTKMTTITTTGDMQ